MLLGSGYLFPSPHRGVFLLLFLQINLLPPYLSLFFSGPYNVDVIALDGGTEFPKTVLNLHNFLPSPLLSLVSFHYPVFQVINSVASSSLLSIP